jgi:hypothetical protein
VQNIDLITDKTFFIMSDGDVKTYYKTIVVEGNVQLLVYDRESPTGYSPLNTQTLKTTFVEYSNEYCDKLKDFIKFLYTDLHQSNKPILYQYIAYIWNGQDDKASECYDEDCTLPEQFEAYMRELKEYDVADQDVVAYFHVIHCEQEITYPRYSEQWLNDNYLITKH